MMDSQGRGLIKALENWAKKITKGYRDVNVHDMSSSFRDGLAFCAIIHSFRPDLIDFDSLSKENILENNQLAFSVAEKQLGVPALLDAEDMVNCSRPDRLSIITYLSQLHNCFENQNKVKAFKRVQNNNVSPVPAKVVITEPKLLSTRRVEKCQLCNNRVFILERLIVDGKLYHTACFRCCKCNNLLNPGAYVESDTPGKYECTVCPDEKMNSMDTDDYESLGSVEENGPSSLNSNPDLLHPIQNNIKSPLTESVTRARASFLENSLSPNFKLNSTNKVPLAKLELKNISTASNKSYNSLEKVDLPTEGISVKAKISAFESNRNSISPEPKSIESISSKESSSSMPYSTNSLPKSPKPSVRLSLISPSSSDKTDSHLKAEERVKVIDNSVVNNVESISLKNTTASKESTELPCDNKHLKSISSRTATLETNTSSIQNSTSDIKTFQSNLDKSSYRKSIGEYKSPLKTSKDIFQNSHPQPLKLTIPTINSTNRDSANSVTPLSATNFSKTPEISQIRLTQVRTLSRPLSFSSLSTQEKSKENSATDLTNEIPRRRSFDSDKNKNMDNKLKYDNTEQNMVHSSSDISSTVVDSRAVLAKSDKQNSKAISNNSFNVNANTPVPSIRKSLELKNLDLYKEKSDLRNITNILTSSSVVKTSPASVKETSTSQSHPLKENSSQELPKLKISTVPPSTKEGEGLYPDDLNPFGDDEAEKEEEYPDDLNPFGDDEENESKPPKVFEGVSADNYDESKNPFASDEEEADKISFSTPSPKPPLSQNNSPFDSLSSPTGSLRGTTKKRKAPKPPKVTDIFPNQPADTRSISPRPSPAVSRKELDTPSPKLRKSKPPPPPPPTPSPRSGTITVKNEDNVKVNTPAPKEIPNEPKKKKRPAPPVPIPMQKNRKKIPLKEIMREMREIEIKQREFEKQGREIELLIRDRDKDEEPSVEEEEYIMQLFELVNQKNALFRRQAELMYIKRSQRLEEQQEELEKQIRELMSKPENEKTEADRSKEEELIYELTDIVDQRNSIIDSIEMDRRRELEEDVSVQEQIEIKNGDLTIAAEIKEKTKGKKEKKDKKKDKEEKKKLKEEKKKDKEKKRDKLHENGESGKSTLKRRLFK